MQDVEHDAVREIAELCRVDLDLDAELLRSFSRIWVAKNEGDVSPRGFLLGWVVADELHVINVATHPDSRRQGVGRALLEELLKFARDNQVRLVLLEVRRSNQAAIQLYRSVGFSAMGVRRGYYSENSEDALEMMLAFDPETGHILPAQDEI